MKFLQYINEVYLDTFKSPISGESYEVFKNPDKKEIRDLYLKHKNEHSGLRFFIDLKKKDVYLFYGDMLHHVVREKLKIDTSDWFKNYPRWLYGEGEFSNGKVGITGISDDVPLEAAGWVKQYFENY
jgi:hypothetical protein